MTSIFFETEENYDFVTIGNFMYSGNTSIDSILLPNFTVVFQSDNMYPAKGFILNWNCLSQWEEWVPLGDGTCREAIGSQPPYNGPDIFYHTKYRKSKETCGRLNAKYIS